MKRIATSAILALIALAPFTGSGQTFGPNNPSAGTNSTSLGNNAWANPSNIYTSNNVRATVSSKGSTNLLQGNGFGFNLLETDIVSGIGLEIEKSTLNVQNVEMVDGSWTVGTARPALASAENRCLIVIIGLENSTSRDINAVSYGGRAMTQLTDIGVGSPVFYGKTEVWYLLESDLALASGTNITYGFATSVPAENFEIVTSALYRNVDQYAPFTDVQTTSSTTSTATLQMSSPIAFIPGSVTITGIFCGNPPNSTTARGNCNGFTINSGFTEMVDYHDYNNSFASSGGVMEVAQLFNTTTGSVQPTFTFNGTPNRRLAAGFTMRRARNWDNTVRLLKNGTPTTTNLANVGVEWPTTDTYTTYGGAGNMWGTTWDYTEINNPSFGGEIAAFVQNAQIGVDHMRMTVYTFSTLPVKLISFTAVYQDRAVYLNWQSGAEEGLDYYQIERSVDGVTFTTVGEPVKAAGNTSNLSAYSSLDQSPAYGVNYYRLKSVDIDGNYEYSDLAPVVISEDAEYTMFPNPTNSWAVLTVNSGYDEIIVMDPMGRIIDQLPGTSIPADVKLNLEQEKDGQYLVVIKRQGETTVKRLTKSSQVLQ